MAVLRMAVVRMAVVAVVVAVMAVRHDADAAWLSVGAQSIQRPVVDEVVVRRRVHVREHQRGEHSCDERDGELLKNVDEARLA